MEDTILGFILESIQENGLIYTMVSLLALLTARLVLSYTKMKENYQKMSDRREENYRFLIKRQDDANDELFDKYENVLFNLHHAQEKIIRLENDLEDCVGKEDLKEIVHKNGGDNSDS